VPILRAAPILLDLPRTMRADDISALVAALGGSSVVPALYDVRRFVTATTIVSSWADALGRSTVPSLTATGTKRPGWDGTALTITFDGVDDCLTSGVNALFDLSGAITLWMVAAFQPTAANDYAAGIAESTSTARLLAVLQNSGASGVLRAQVGAGSAFAAADSTVTVGATRRLILVSKNASTGVSVDVPSQARVSATNTGSVASGTNAFSVGNAFTGFSLPASPVVRAAGCLSRQATVQDIATILAWAKTYHGAVAA
jgi:hypothetical protein